MESCLRLSYGSAGDGLWRHLKSQSKGSGEAVPVVERAPLKLWGGESRAVGESKEPRAGFEAGLSCLSRLEGA